jgi:uncharacterized membrane protein YbhN (UPF0104 family)
MTVRRWLRFYNSPRGAPTARRATDGLLLGLALIPLAILVAAYPPGQIERAVARLLRTLSGWPDPMWGFLYDLLAGWAIAMIVAVVVSRRGAVVVQTLAAAVTAVAVRLVTARLASGHWPGLGDAIESRSGGPAFPAFRIAEAGAVILAVGPYLVRGLQRVGRWVLLLGLVGGLFLHPADPSGALAAVLVAVIAANGVRLVLGTSIGRPGLGDVAASLAELGVDATGLAAVQRQVSGVFSLEAEDGAGRPLLVKIYGRDAYDTQVLATFWRTLWYQDAGPTLGLSRVQAVEREALVTLLAARAGVPVREVVRAGATLRGDALLVLGGEVRPLGDLGADDLDDAMLARFWDVLARLREARVGHGEIQPATVGLVGGEPGVLDFGQGTVTPRPDRLGTDGAQLLAATATVAGEERAIAAALAARGRDGVTALLPYLQPPAFGAALRRALKERGLDVDDLRKAASAAVGVTDPEPARLRRVTWGTVIQIALLLLAVGALMKVAGNVDYEQLRTDLDNASLGWIAAAFVAAQLPRLTQAASTLGSIAAEIRFGPVYVLQLATSYLNLALPSSIARMAVFVRFFQRQGLAPAAAVASGAIDSFMGNAIQLVLVLTLLLFSSDDVGLQLEGPGSGSIRLIGIAAALLVLTVLAVLLVGRIRRAVVARVREWWPQVKAAFGTLRSPNKLLLLIGGNLATEILFATALGLMARGFGAQIPLPTLILINSGTSLFASFIPVPGGIGVVEFGLEAGLTSAGMTPSAALGAILLYRVSTFYLPPVWGFFAFRWLQRNRYL